jgi:hypothetical protein
MAWFVRYAATAVAHGHLPALVTPALNAPMGINLMWNNTILFPALLLAPVTLLAGPIASLTVLTTLGFAGSAAAMYWLLRRHGAGVGAAALGGLVFGFSPAMVNASNSHYGMVLAAGVPLMTGAVLAIACGRGSPVAQGAWLGLLAAAQLYTGEELLVDAAMVCLVLLAALAVSRPWAVPGRLRAAALGLGTAAAVAVALSAYGLWRQFRGPLVSHGTPWKIADHGNSFGAFVNPQSGLVFHTASSAAYAHRHMADTSEYLAYLGWPLLVVTAGVTVWYWRDLRVRAAGVAWAVLEALSLGVTSPLLPFHWLQSLPLFGDMLPSRLSLVADGGAAAVLAFGLDLALAARSRRAPAPATPRARAARWAHAAVPVTVALLAVAPLVPRPVPVIASAPVPSGWDATFAALHLPVDASVLAVPVAWSHAGETMLWQADAGQPAELNAGWFLGPNAKGKGSPAYWGPPATTATKHCLDTLWQVTAPMSAAWERDCATDLRSALAYWHPAAIVAATVPGTPLALFLAAQLSHPTITTADLQAWRAN